MEKVPRKRNEINYLVDEGLNVDGQVNGQFCRCLLDLRMLDFESLNNNYFFFKSKTVA